MEKHVNVIGILLIAFGVMGLLACSVVSFLFLVMGMFTGMLSAESGFIVSGTILTAFFFIFAISSLPMIIAGWGIMKLRNWARILGLVMSFILLFEFPLGTALGIYGLWALLHEDTAKLFNKPQAQTVQA